MVKNGLDATFGRLKKSRSKAFIAYLAAGYPGFGEQEKLIESLVRGGVDILELGIPFSDPIADGPTIQFASQKSLDRGTTLRKIMAWVPRLRKRVRIPIVFMSYLNPIDAYGVEKFAADAGRAGVSGVIVPDLIPEEASDLAKALKKRHVALIHLVAPTTPRDRQRLIARKTNGFLYAVSVSGVTGARRALPVETGSWLKGLKRLSRLPVCVGFGISGPQQVRELRKSADGFIVGSALIDIIRKNKSSKRAAVLERFARALSRECHHGR